VKKIEGFARAGTTLGAFYTKEGRARGFGEARSRFVGRRGGKGGFSSSQMWNGRSPEGGLKTGKKERPVSHSWGGIERRLKKEVVTCGVQKKTRISVKVIVCCSRREI